MTDSNNQSSIRFYFSFRSPYSWLAAERLESELGDLGVEIARLPVYPTPELAPQLFPNEPGTIRDGQTKMRYRRKGDVASIYRFAPPASR